MRAPLCKRCGDVVLLPGGQPHYIGRVSHFPLTLKDFRCKRQVKITAAEWNALQDDPGAVLETGARVNPQTHREPGWKPKKVDEVDA